MYGHQIVNSVEDIVNGYYSPWNSSFAQDCVRVIKMIEEKGEHLSVGNIEQLVKKMTKGKTKSIIGKNNKNIEGLNTLAKNHLLSDLQIKGILTCFSAKEIDDRTFVWIDNLILQKYEPSKVIWGMLVKMGYRQGVDIIMNKNESSIADFHAICGMKEISYERIEEYLKKFKVVPTMESVGIVVSKFGELCSFPVKIDGVNKLSRIIEKFVMFGLAPGLELLVSVCSYMYFEKIGDYVDELFRLCYVRNLGDLSFLFGSQIHHFTRMSNIVYMLKKCKKYCIGIDVGALMPMVTCIGSDMRGYGYRQLGYVSGSATLAELIEKYRMVINLFLMEGGSINDKVELELLERACLVSDRLMFDVLMKRLNKFTNRCLINACASGSVEMVVVFFGMKALGSIECLEVIPLGAKVLFDLLLANGLPVNLKTIELAMGKGLFIDKLFENYGFEPGLDLYRLCHRYSLYPDEYVRQMCGGFGINWDIRRAINSFGVNNEEGIVAMIRDRGMVPDEMMYDDALVCRKEVLLKYFENEWGMKLNLTSIMRVNLLGDRLWYLDRLVKSGVVPENIIRAKAEKKVEFNKA
ncbi:MAG: hypothetical protein Hyperionvirus30_4 [Hyperionvirus sp.]|uniref:Uncharacterized protein n=1 Tax=Hyperionvirus sp. TaxID=2487770 RepID=A0A3G5ABH7_9VIRU|nr:MAG: hypothetical protein Hyperionvirus30_4 [Hyperionvirus sp.]